MSTTATVTPAPSLNFQAWDSPSGRRVHGCFSALSVDALAHDAPAGSTGVTVGSWMSAAAAGAAAAAGVSAASSAAATARATG